MDVLTVTVWWTGFLTTAIAGRDSRSPPPTCCSDPPAIPWPITAFAWANATTDGACGQQLRVRTVSGVDWCLRVPPHGAPGDWVRALRCELEGRRDVGRELARLLRRVLDNPAHGNLTSGELYYAAFDLGQRRHWERDLEYDVWEAGTWRPCLLRVELHARARSHSTGDLSGWPSSLRHRLSLNVTVLFTFRATDGGLLSRCTRAELYRRPLEPYPLPATPPPPPSG